MAVGEMTQAALPFEDHCRPRHEMPAQPWITREFGNPDFTERYMLCRLWSKSIPPLAWLAPYARATADGRLDRGLERMTVWSYQAGYGGVLVLSLYPAFVRSQEALLAWRRGYARPDEVPPEDGWMTSWKAASLLGWAKEAARYVREYGCRRLVMATGDLTPAQGADFETWRAEFEGENDARVRHRLDQGKWLCLGFTEAGWPIDVLRQGRTAIATSTPLVRFHDACVAWWEAKGALNGKNPPGSLLRG